MSDCSSSSEDEDLPRLVSRMVVDGGGGDGQDIDDENDDGDEDMEGEELYVDSLQPARDLFSDKTFRTAEECIDHCRNVHGLDLNLLKRRHTMDTFSYIRFVNYLRTERPSPGFVMSLGSDAKWAEERFLRPVLEDDPMLMFNFDDEIGDATLDGDDDENGFEIDISRDLNDEIENPRSFGGCFSAVTTPSVVDRLPTAVLSSDTAETGRTVVVDRSTLLLQEQISLLQQQLAEKDYQLGLCSADMNRMRSAAQALFASSSAPSAFAKVSTFSPVQAEAKKEFLLNIG